MGVCRYYLTPPLLLAGQTLPERWGLLEVGVKNRVRVQRVAQCFDAAAASAAEAPLLIRFIRMHAGQWYGLRNLYVHPGHKAAAP